MAKKEDLMKEFGEAEMRPDFKAPVKPIAMPSQSTVHDDLADLPGIGPPSLEEPKTTEPEEGAQPEGKEAEHAHVHHSSSSHHHKKKKHKFIRAVVNIFSDRTFCKMLNSFLFCLSVNAFEYFFLINQKGIQTRGAISKLFGVIVIFVFLYSARLKPRNLGLPPDVRLIVSGVKRAMLFSLAFIPAYLVDMLIVLIRHGKPRLTVFAYNQPLSSVGFVDWAANILLLLAISVLSAFMLEFLFRGIIFRMGKSKFGFGQTAFIVSLFYAIWYLIIPLSKVMHYTPISILPLCVFYLVFEFILSFKWCLCVRATNAVWLAIFDHFLFIAITGLLRVVDTTANATSNIDTNKYWRYVVFQLISFVLCYLYYKKKMLLRQKRKRASGSRSGFVYDSLADMVPEDISSDKKPLSVDEDSIDETYKEYLNKHKTSDSHHS